MGAMTTHLSTLSFQLEENTILFSLFQTTINIYTLVKIIMFSSVSENWSTFSSMDDRLPDHYDEVDISESMAPSSSLSFLETYNIKSDYESTNASEGRSSTTSSFGSSNSDPVKAKKSISMLRITSLYCKRVVSRFSSRRRDSRS